jgi:Icc-related predicted phosphoesterase
VIRVAAIGDVHVGQDLAGRLRPQFEDIQDRADVLLLAGDLTRLGTVDEAAVAAAELGGLGVPTVAVLGNHDYHSDEPKAVTAALEAAGIQVLEGDGTVIAVNGATVGIAGTKGFGGGFAGASGSEFGEPLMKEFIRHTQALATELADTLLSFDTDYRVALLHYSPSDHTLTGEPLPIYPFLGSYLLAEAIDSTGTDLAVHGHAHHGREKGITPGGVHVRNVARPVLGRAYAIYCLGEPPDPDCD